MVKVARSLALVGALVGATLVVPTAAQAAPVGGALFGTVTAVDGSTAAGSCGTAAAAGTVAVATRSGSRTVTVTPSTTFIDPRVATASFAQVCVGRSVAAAGFVASGVLDARFVVVAPPLPTVAVGLVTAVNGSATPGTCGTAGAAGTFVLSTRSGTPTVSVSASTVFAGVTSPSFAKVCVNGVVAAVGNPGPTLDAFRVVVTSFSGPVTLPTARAIGVVSSVNGNSTPGTCGTAGATGTFVLATRTGARSVEVAGATAFVDPRVATDTFGSVCVGRLVGALGSPGSGSACLAVGCPADPIAARFVVVAGPAPVVVVGAVTAVGGQSGPGTCGTAGGTGTVDLVTRTGTAAFSVSLGTQFRGVIGASYGKVCVGGVVVVVGAPGTTIGANRVILTRRVI